MHKTRTLKLKQLNGIQPSSILLFISVIFPTVTCQNVSCEKGVLPPSTFFRKIVNICKCKTDLQSVSKGGLLLTVTPLNNLCENNKSFPHAKVQTEFCHPKDSQLCYLLLLKCLLRTCTGVFTNSG